MPLENTILIGEDEDDEAFLLQRTLKKTAFSDRILRVKNGEEVIQYLSGENVFGDRGQFPMPVILLLDLNMPKKSGFEVMEWIRSQPALKALAIDVFSGSSRAEDIDRALRLGANLYLKKPISLNELEELFQGYRQVLKWRGFIGL